MSKLISFFLVAMVSLPALSNESSKTEPGKMDTWKVGEYIEGFGIVTDIRKNGDKVEIEMTGMNGEKISVSYDENKKKDRK
ncbi:MAG TPA: hypothetical protein VE954_06580 [Oligoflexus sp.]|uniref:hypothetical protein n=1 Tax=Oligoflexus sp. TaxID=1971216 RepID=UPI002D2D0CDD|nr:hypothetical protein [Oligoflexus sp.]HYX32762.1 hypothetical protein [Oligoflexus sp.]